MSKRHVVALLVASALAGVGVAAAAGPDSLEPFPLPAGGNFNGIRWPQDETLEPRGGGGDAGLQRRLPVAARVA